jgi:beta-lactamase class A
MAEKTHLTTVNEILQKCESEKITVGVTAIDLRGHAEPFNHNQQELFEIGSVIKIGVLVEILSLCEQKKLDLATRIELLNTTKVVGSGILRNLTEVLLGIFLVN